MTTEPKPKRDRKGGRPKLSDLEFRGISVKIGMNQAEREKFIKLCESVGAEQNRLTQANFARKLLLSDRIYSVSQINREALTELNRIGNNLNQALKVLHNQNFVSPEMGFAIVAISKMKSDITKIATELVGQND